MTFLDRYWDIQDWIIPLRQPFSKADLARAKQRELKAKTDLRSRAAGVTDTDLKDRLIDIKGLLASEDERRKSVDGRLTSILGLFSVAGTVVFGTILARPATLAQYSQTGRFLVTAITLYFVLQIVCATYAAAVGLGRRSYLMPTADDVLPLAGEASNAHFHRQIDKCLEALDNHYANNDEKVTQMAIAHRAMRNFSLGLILLAVVGNWQGSAPQASLSEANVSPRKQVATTPPPARQGSSSAPVMIGPAGEHSNKRK